MVSELSKDLLEKKLDDMVMHLKNYFIAHCNYMVAEPKTYNYNSNESNDFFTHVKRILFINRVQHIKFQ